MRKWNRMVLITSAIMAMGVFTACTSTTKTETTTPIETTAPQEITAADTTAKQPETFDERELVSAGEGYGNPVVDLKKMFEDFGGLIGQPDDKTTALLGEGTIEPTEGEPVSTRQYAMEVFGVDTVTDVFYDGDQVSMIQLIPEGIDRVFCTEEINEALGTKGTEKTSTNDGSEIHTVTWVLEKVSVVVREAFDTVTVEVIGK